MRTVDFDYYLPPELIAQTPLEPRDRSRLMLLDRRDGSVEHRTFPEITGFLRAGDVMVFNDSRVIPARLEGREVDSGVKLEVLLLRQLEPGLWETLAKPAKRVKPGARIEIIGVNGNRPGVRITAEAISVGEGGTRLIRFSDEARLPELGKIPLPPYIHLPLKDPERYQTVYARMDGSAAAPTAGLHFTPELLGDIQSKGVRCLFVTLHIGLDTFRPVREDNPLEHPIHREYGVVSREVAEELSRAKAEGRRIICVGTTAVRLLEAAAQTGISGGVPPFSGWVDLFIVPGHRFRMADVLITNFHLPRSTLLMLVSAFAGSDLINQAYREAIARQYRFYSFGDAMLVI